MTSKQRIKAAMAQESVDRLPFWPKLDEAYRIRWGKHPNEFHEYIGSDPVTGTNPVFTEKRTNTALETARDGNDAELLYTTPSGTLRQVNRFDSASQAMHPIEFPIKTLRDVGVMAAWFRDAEVVYDPGLREQAQAKYDAFGDKAFVNTGIGESSLMQFIEWLAGVENAHYLLADHPGEVEDLFDAMHRNLLRKVEISAEYSPADSIMLVENTSTTLISPSQYDRYCFPQIQAYGEIARSRGKLLMLHMCGHLKRLLPSLGKLPAHAFEAYTSPTVGDTTLLDGRAACPDKCLIGGTNAAVWLGTADSVFAHMAQQLDALPHHRGIVVSSAGVMPPACTPDTIKAVKDRLNEYKVVL
jgi:hypothetical protein